MEIPASYGMTNNLSQDATEHNSRAIKPVMQPPEGQTIEAISKVGNCTLKVATMSI
jgi:hypothetical protein